MGLTPTHCYILFHCSIGMFLFFDVTDVTTVKKSSKALLGNCYGCYNPCCKFGNNVTKLSEELGLENQTGNAVAKTKSPNRI
jgi:hypothetical protein